VIYNLVSVAISHGTDAVQTLEDSLNKIGGIKQFFREKSTVFINPGLTLPLGPPVTTQPQLLGYILRLCQEAGAKEVYIGFNPFDGISSKQVLKLLALDYYLDKFGGTLLNLENESYSSIQIKNPYFFDTVYFPDKFLQSDIFISLVAPRTDLFGEYALGLRTYFDLMTDKQKQRIIQTGSLQGLLDFYKIKSPQLTIWDAMHVGEGQGPFNQQAVTYNLILASTNLLAGDSIMSYLMGIDPPQVEALRTAAEHQLEPIDPKEIIILGENLSSHCKTIKKPIISSKNLSKEIEIIEGKTCPGCQIGLRYMLDFFLRFIEKDLKEFGGFTCFLGDLPPDLTHTLKNGVILFGNCALSSNYPINFNNKTQKQKYFFRFPGCPPLNLRTIEQFCLDFKEWLPSLEIIEEFIRKWTIGRPFRSIQASS